MHLLYVSIKYINIVFIMEYGTLYTQTLSYNVIQILRLYIRHVRNEIFHAMIRFHFVLEITLSKTIDTDRNNLFHEQFK